MTWNVRALLGWTALVAACGVENGHHDVRREAGATTGGNGFVGGSAGDAGSAGTITVPSCPEEEPEEGSPCDSTAVDCRYDGCADGVPKMLSCREQQWRVARACGPLECPEARPTFLSDCTPLEGLECQYVEDCCGGEPSTQSVFARCQSGQWRLDGVSVGEGCAFCRIHHEDGEACDLPPACVATGCYRVSCYGQPAVEECIDGVWRAQTLCSK